MECLLKQFDEINNILDEEVKKQLSEVNREVLALVCGCGCINSIRTASIIEDEEEGK